MRGGAPESRRGDEGTRVRRVVTMVLGQSKMFERPAIGRHLPAYLISEGFAAAAFGTAGEYWSPAGLVLGGALSALGATAAKVGYVAFWWIDVLLILFLVTYIPLSKHFHILTSPFNVYFKSTRPKGELRKIENIEEAEHFGVSDVRQFTWKDLLDGYSCTECG